MAFTLPHADEYGDAFPKSYWKPAQVNLSSLDKTGVVVFYGFEGEAEKGKRVIGQKSYAVTPQQFGEFFAADELNPEGRNPWAAAYEFALSVKGAGADGQSFFGAATPA